MGGSIGTAMWILKRPPWFAWSSPLRAMVPLLLLRRRPSRLSGARSGSGLARSRVLTGFALASMGAITGPYLGVWMSLVATDRAPLGVAQTLCSLTPIFFLPAARLVYGEAIGLRAALGTCLAVGGVGLLLAGT